MEQITEERSPMTTANPTPRRRPRRPHVMAALAATAFGTLASVLFLSPAGASSSSTTTTTNPSATGNTGSGVVITPLLELFEFGNNIGLPLACSDAGSVISIIGTQTGGTAVSSALVTELDSQCAQLSAKGGDALTQAIAQSRALTLLNPVINPLIADLAKALNLVGTEYGGSLSPFGPTVAGLGGTVTFFEGS
jgi:hypothetical protein